VTNGAERTRWKIRGDRVVDENPRIRLSVASLELADGTRFDQYVMRLPRCAITVVLDEAAERMLRRHHHRSPARAADRGPAHSLTWPRFR
jgi:hypothetical protein